MKKNSVVLIGMLIITMLLTGCQLFVSIEITGGVRGWVYETKSDYPKEVIVMPSKEVPRGYQPLPYARVELWAHNRLAAYAETNYDGYFSFPSVSAGEYLLVIRHPSSKYRDVKIPVYIWGDIRVISSEPTVHYVIVGIDEYPHMDAENLKVSANDAKAIKEVLVNSNKMKGYAEVLINSRATKNNIRRAIKNAARAAKPGDSLVFYFSGYADTEIYAGGAVNELDHIVPYDGRDYGSPTQIRNSVITDGELEQWLSEFPNKNVTVILEVAYAETFFDGVIRTQGVGEIAPLALKGKGYTVLGATSSNQRNIVTPEKLSKFTEFIVKGLEYDIRGDLITAGALFDYVDQKMYEVWLEAPDHKKDDVPIPQFEGSKNTVIYIRDSFYW